MTMHTQGLRVTPTTTSVTLDRMIAPGTRGHPASLDASVQEDSACNGVSATSTRRKRRVGLLVDDPTWRAAIESCLLSGDDVTVVRNKPGLSRWASWEDVSCLIIESRLLTRANSGHEQLALSLKGLPPVIFVTASQNVQFAVRAMRAGAFDVVGLPLVGQEILDALNMLPGSDSHAQTQDSSSSKVSQRFASLTPRERQIMAAVISGRMNKQVADALNLSIVTVKMHRGRVMRKMGVDTFAELVKMGGALGLTNLN